MCCVMPPNSCSVTLVRRMASRSVVLPWSTCPITVITGGLGTSLRGMLALWLSLQLGGLGFARLLGGRDLDRIAPLLRDLGGDVSADLLVHAGENAHLHKPLLNIRRGASPSPRQAPVTVSDCGISISLRLRDEVLVLGHHLTNSVSGRGVEFAGTASDRHLRSFRTAMRSLVVIPRSFASWYTLISLILLTSP